MLVRVIVWVTLIFLSLFCAYIAVGFGASSIFAVYIPHVPETSDELIAGAVFTGILWAPLIYALFFWRWAVRRDRAQTQDGTDETFD